MTSLKLGIIGAVALIIISIVGGGLFYIHWLKAENKVLTANNEKLELALKTEQEATRQMKKDIRNIAEYTDQVNEKYNLARDENDALRKRLSKHNIGFLAQKKPKLVGKILNNATDNVERCFEILSGLPLTEKEKNATKPSEINRECPGIANPNYEETH